MARSGGGEIIRRVWGGVVLAEAEARRVLVVEDEALLLFAIADDLRDAGYQVYEATGAAAALKVIDSTGGIDVLFTDVDMPGQMDGLGLARAVKSRLPAAHIIVTSGHINLAPKDLPPGGRFVPKPYLPSFIVNTIRGLAG
jgi:CheY-like chemotaxis protein